MYLVNALLVFSLFDISFGAKILIVGQDENEYEATISNAPDLEVQTFSICWSVKTRFRTPYDFLITANTSSVHFILKDFSGSGETLFINFSKYMASILIAPKGKKIVPHSWSSICITYNDQNLELALYLNSDQIFVKRIPRLQDLTLPKDFLHNLIFPVDKNSCNLTDLNIWSKVLTKDEVADIYQCDPHSPHPDLVAWQNISFTINPDNPDIRLTTIQEKESPCEERKEHIYLVETPVTMVDRRALRVCSAIGGSMPVMKNQSDLMKLKDIQSAVWVPIFKGKDNWLDETGSAVSFLPWGEGGEDLKGDCAFFFNDNYYLNPCLSPLNFYCQMQSYPEFKLKGKQLTLFLIALQYYLFLIS